MSSVLDLTQCRYSVLTQQPCRWQFRGGSESVALPKELVKAAEGSSLLARLLWNRNVRTPEAIAAFLAPPCLDALAPWQQLPDAEIGVQRILAAIEAQESILVYGDFDVDGITGTSLFYETLQRLGAKVSYHVPDRLHEGHGLNNATLLRLVSSRSVKLVITTDTGISNFKEVSLLNNLGVDTVITDHHELPEHLPLAVANINCQRLEDKQHPLANLSGAGVAFKLCQGLYEARLEAGEARTATLALLDLCAAGLVADMMPLQGENRHLVQLGLMEMQHRRRVGLKWILESAGVTPETALTAESIGFTIGPRLNALGRLENATEAVTLLTTTDSSVAQRLAQRLEGLNKQRQQLCEQTFQEAERHLLQSGGLSGRKAIVLASADWNPGIVGIVASRLIEKYRLPTMLGMVDEAAGTVRCSARSIPAFHLTENLEPLADRFFLNFGGHAGAAGFSLKRNQWEAFQASVYQIAEQRLNDADTQPTQEVDMVLEWSQLNAGLSELLDKLAPFGQANPSPLFALANVKVGAQRALGQEGTHRKFMMEPVQKPRGKSIEPLETLLWKCGSQFALDASLHYHLLVTVERNDYPKGPPIKATLKDVQRADGQTLVVSDVQATDSPKASTTPLPAPLASARTASRGGAWVDHRNRPQLGEFVSQLLLPPATQQTAKEAATVLLFNEGRSPSAIPFLDAALVASRSNLTPCHTLLLWDIPPSLPEFQALLAATQPTQVHVLGGKYQLPTATGSPLAAGEGKVALALPLPVFLRGVHQGVLLLLEGATGRLSLSEASHRFATTEGVLLLALAVLEAGGLVSGSVQALVCQPLAPAPAYDALCQQQADSFALHALQQGIGSIAQWRAWCLSAPLTALEALV